MVIGHFPLAKEGSWGAEQKGPCADSFIVPSGWEGRTVMDVAGRQT